MSTHPASMPSNTLAEVHSGSEDAILAFVPGDPGALLSDILQAGGAAPGGGAPFVTPGGMLYGGRFSLSLCAAPVELTCHAPASWQLAAPRSPGLRRWPDPRDSWLLNLGTDVRLDQMQAAGAALDVIAPAVLLRIIAGHNLLAMMDSGRAPGRVNAVVIPTSTGPAEALIHATPGQEAAVARWAHAIGPDVPVRPSSDLSAFDALTEVDPLDRIGLHDRIAAFPAAAEQLAPLLGDGPGKAGG